MKQFNLLTIIFLFMKISLLAQSMGINTPTPNTMLDVNGAASFREGTALALVNGVNNDVVLTNYSFFRITGPTAAFSITGFANGNDGRTLTIVNASGQALTLSNQTVSTAANQINTGGLPIVLPANGIASFIYNANLSKWLVSGTIGATPNFSNITTGAVTDSLLVTNNGIPAKVRPTDMVKTYAWALDGNIGTTAGTNFVGTTDSKDLVFKTNNTEGMRLTTNQTLGIGTIGPLSTARLHVENIGTNHAFYAPIGTNYNYFAGKTAFGRATSNPTTTLIGTAADPLVAIQDSITTISSSVVSEGLAVKLKVVPTAASTGGVYGINARVHTAAYNGQNIGTLEASNFDLRHYGTGTLANGYGTITRCVNLGTGRINKAFGMIVDVGNYGGTVDSLWGVQIGGGGFGTMTNANFAIGLHIGDMIATTGYGIWQGGGDDKNYLAGNTGIGTNLPTNTLHVNATANPLRLEGLQSSAPTDSILTVSPTGVVRRTNTPVYNDIMDLKGATSVPAGTVAITATATALGTATTKIYTTTFTITRPSLVLVDASISSKGYRTTSGSAISDGSVRMVKSYWSFLGSTVRYGTASSIYSNTTADAQVLNGIFNSNNGFNTVLAAGTYTLELYLLAGCSSGRTFQYDYGGDINDRISIKAIQLQ